MKKLAWVLPLFLALVLVPLWAIAQKETPKEVAPGSSTEQPGPKTPDAEAGKSAGHHQMNEKCKEMMAKHEQFKADWKAMDTRLDEKLAAMNAAKGDNKTAAMAAVINEMAAQRKEMREKKSAMHMADKCCAMMGHGGKMGGMKGHGGGMDGGMAGCEAMMDKHGAHGAGT